MENITLKNVLPEVFASRNDIQSEIWHKEVLLEKGKVYLVEANSGTGKSSLCSYIAGYRRDYQGIIDFDGKNICNLRKRGVFLPLFHGKGGKRCSTSSFRHTIRDGRNCSLRRRKK